MSENQDRDERPCLHCMIMDLLEDFFSEYPASHGEPDTIDTDEVISALAKTVAELTRGQNGANRQQIIEKLMREIMDYDAEFRREDASGRSALLCGTKHFGVPSVSPDSSLIPPSGSNLTRQLVSELCPQLGYCVGLLIPPRQSHVHSAARHMHTDEFLQHQRRLRQRVSFAQF